MKKNNIIIFSDHFIKKRVIEEKKFYNNEIVGECVECNGEGIILECYPEEICVDCDGTGIIYYGKENIN